MSTPRTPPHKGKVAVTIRVDGLARMVEMTEALGDKEQVDRDFVAATEAAARRVVQRTVALAGGYGRLSASAARRLTIDATSTGAAVVVDPSSLAYIVGGLFGAAHDRPRRRVRRVRGVNVSGNYRGFNQFPLPIRPPLPFRAFSDERENIEGEFLKALEAIVARYTTTT